jgi:hypothetical protein
MDMGDTRTLQYALDKPLDDTMTVKMTIIVGLKTVTVPFDLKNIPLP